MRKTLKTLVPPAGIRAKLLHKIQKLNDKSTDVQIIHEVSTKARPVHEAVNAETVGEASSAQQLIKTCEDLFTLPKGQSQTYFILYENGHGSRRGGICKFCPRGSILYVSFFLFF